MKYALFSDIHANAAALQSTLDRCRALCVDKIINLGDVVGYGSRPNECCEMLRAHEVISIAGNHDLAACGVFEPVYFQPEARRRMLWTRAVLSAGSRRYLESLPETLVIDNAFVVVHGSLKSYSQYLLTEEAIHQSFALLKKNYPGLQACFFGHTHKAAAHELNGEGLHNFEAVEMKLNAESLYLINPGSIGYPRYADSPLSFAVYDSSGKTVRFIRLDEEDGRLQRDMQPDIALDAALVRQYVQFVTKAGARFIRNRFLNRVYAGTVKRNSRNDMSH